MPCNTLKRQSCEKDEHSSVQSTTWSHNAVVSAFTDVLIDCGRFILLLAISLEFFSDFREKMYIIAQFGAATESIMKATVEGNHKEGVQFIGQSQGLIGDIPSVDELVQRIILEAVDALTCSYVTFSGKGQPT